MNGFIKNTLIEEEIVVPRIAGLDQMFPSYQDAMMVLAESIVHDRDYEYYRRQLNKATQDTLKEDTNNLQKFNNAEELFEELNA